MSAYKVFIKERLPVIPNLILAAGLMLSAYSVMEVESNLAATILGALALFTFVSELRFMDELKDVAKDKVANPDRPLPRGAIQESQVNKLIIGTGALLCLFSALLAALFSPQAGGLLGVATVWLYLMYKEFFVGDWLSKKPLLYAITHQIVIFPLCLFALSLYGEVDLMGAKALSFGLVVLSAFFTFEVGRKLDPKADKILGTYLIAYGAPKTLSIIIALQVIAVIAALQLSALWWTLAPAILVLLTLPKVITKPEKYKDVEGVISLNLIYIVWMMAIKHLVETI